LNTLESELKMFEPLLFESYQQFKKMAFEDAMNRIITAIYKEKINSDNLSLFTESGDSVLFHFKDLHITAKRFSFRHLEIIDYYYPSFSKHTELYNDFWETFLKDAHPRVAGELANSIFNTALAWAGLEQAPKPDYLAIKQKNTDTQERYFESLCHIGHPTHPMTKTKIGFTLEDNLNYGPEFTPIVALSHLEIPASLLHLSGDVPVTDNYTVTIPVHPYQFKKTLLPFLKTKLNLGIITLLENQTLAVPLTSTRTLKTTTGYIKTPLDVQLTSAKRTLSRFTAHNGPLYSQLLKQLQQQHPQAFMQTTFLSEYAGVSFKTEDAHLSRQLSTLWRENLPIQPDNWMPIVSSALYHSHQLNQDTILKQVLLDYGRGNLTTTGIQNWFEAYLSLILKPVLTLVATVGVGIEAHMQNTVVYYENGYPCHVVFRDWGDMRINVNQLKSQGFNLDDVLPDSPGLDYQGDRKVDNVIRYSLFQHHLAVLTRELIKIDDNLTETILWSQVKQAIKHLDLNLDDRLFAPTVNVKGLLSMRMATSDDHYTWTEVENPLALVG
jgi:siderophore synthetase component